MHNFLSKTQTKIQTLQYWQKLLAVFLAGALTGWVQAPLSIWVLPFVTFTFLLLVTAPLKGPQAYWVGWFFCFGYFLFGLYWIANALFVDIGQFWWALPFAIAGLPSLLAFIQAIGVWAAQQWCGENGRHRAFMLALMWALMEWVRGHVFTGFPWLLVGQFWVDVDWARQVAAVGGIYFLSLWSMLLFVLPSYIFSYRRTGILVLLILTGSAFFYGEYRLTRMAQLAAQEEATPLKIRMVQPNIDQSLKLNPGARDEIITRTMQAAYNSNPFSPAPQAIIWPETAVPYRLEDDQTLREILARTLPPESLLITGSIRKNTEGDYFNSVIVMDSQGVVLGHYDKAHLVPFGEYIPFHKYLPFDPVASGKDFSAGAGAKTLSLLQLPPFAPMICYEVIFPGAVVDENNRPHWMINVTNDGWYGLSHGPYQHLDIARIRAVEEGLPLVRVANTGISAAIDQTGKIIEKIPLNTMGMKDATIIPTALPTIYNVVGDKVFFLAILGIFLLLDQLRRSKKQ